MRRSEVPLVCNACMHAFSFFFSLSLSAFVSFLIILRSSASQNFIVHLFVLIKLSRYLHAGAKERGYIAPTRF
jgi:ABC-type sulfate transport system permease component